MSLYRNAIRFFTLTFAFALPLGAYAANYDVRVLMDTDANRATGCTVPTANGPVTGIEQVLTTSITVNGGAGIVTGVTRQLCSNGFFGSPIAVDPGGWNVGVSSTGNLFLETHAGANVMTMTNIGTMRLAFMVTSGPLADALTNDSGDDILYPVRPGRHRAVSTGALRTIHLDGVDTDWAGVPVLANGDAASPALRFLDASAYVDSSDLFFSFHIQANANAPTALDDSYSLATLGGTLTVSTLGVLTNDSDPNNLALSAILVEGPQHGTLTLNANGGFTYVNDGSDSQQDQFTYRVTNGTLVSNVATVTINLPGGGGGPISYTFTSADHVTFTAGQFNSFHVTVTGKPTPALTEDGALPAGVSFTDNGDGTGTLSGAPAANTVGTYPIVFHAEKNKPHQTDQNFTLTVACPVIAVINPTINTGTVGVPFSQTFTQAGGSNPITWSESGALPAGLTFHTATGVLDGTPTQSGTFPITVTATDANNCTGTTNYTLTILCNSVTVTNPAVNSGTVNVAFSQTFTQAGGALPITWSETGALPAGLTFHSGTGVLDGTPTQTGVFHITVTATDAHSCSGTGGTYTLTIGCQVITVTNPVTNTGTVNTAFSQTFTAGNAIAPVTFTLNSGTLPAGITLSSAGVLSGTPTQTGSFPITVHVVDHNGCSANGGTYTLTVGCQVITVNNPATNTGTVNVAFNQAFTAGNAIAPVTFTLNSGTLPAGITLSSAGVLSGTPTQTGSFPITVHAVDNNGCSANGGTFTLTIACQVITVNNPATNTGTVNVAFSQTFTASNAIGATTFTTASTLPAGLSLSTGGVLSGTPTQTGSFPIVVHVVDANGCAGNGATYTLTIACQVITVTNPATTTGTVNVAFSQTFTASNAIGATTFTTASTLPAGLSLSPGGVLSGTPTQTGSFPIVVHVVDANSCAGNGATYTLVIGCQVITVNNPVTNTGTVNTVFGQTFTASNTIGTVTFTTASTLPAGLTLSTGGVLSGTPLQTGSFPIVVHAVDANGCSGNGATYTLTIGCQVISVTNPATTTGTVNTAFSQTFTAGNTVGTVTFTTASTLPTGLSLSTGGVLSGTPTQTGSFGIVVTATDGNGCSGSGSTYTLVIGCQTITVTNPVNTTGTVSAPFTEVFTSSNTVGTVTYSTASTLPAGLTLASNGTLSGTPTQTGTFPIVVTATDANGCTGNGPTYTLIIGCQVITVTNPATATGPAGTPFSQTFTQSGGIGTTTFSESGALPTGLTFHTATGVLDGTPTQTGTFPITVTATDQNGCTGTGATYNLIITCPTITVTNPGTTTGTVNIAFSQTFTQSGGIGTTTFSESGALPAGLTFHTATGVLDGTPTQSGTFPIVVTATDSNGCTGSGATYNLVIGCQVITVNNPGTNTGTVNTAFSQTFTASNTIGAVTFTTASTLPTGLSLSTGGVLSGTPLQTGSFPIVVHAVDANGCSGNGATYTLTIGCQVISVTNPSTTTGTVNTAFSQTFTAGNTVGTVTFTTASTLPTGLSLSTGGVLSGTPTQTGSFPIVVTATDGNGCSGSGSTYTLVIGCQTITVTNPSTNTGTVNAGFSQQFTAGNTIGSVTFTTASALPAGITLSTGGLLAGTPTQAGTFPIVVTATDANSCSGSGATYNLIIACQVITVTNPANATGPAGTPFSETFTQSGAVGTTSFTLGSGTLPTGLTLHAATGILDGTPTQGGTFPITVTVTDANGCTGTGPTYNLIITCPVITVTNPGVSTGTAGTAFSQTFTQSGGVGTVSWSETGALPSGISINSSTGVLSGTTTQVGSFPITVTATDANGCQGTGSTYTLVINCQTVTVTNPGVNTGTVDAPFSQTFGVTGILGTVTWSETGALPASITLDPSTGVLSGTPAVPGSFPIIVKATDTNGCFGTSSYTLTISCQTITVNNPATTTGTVDAPFSQTFTQSGVGTHTPATFTLNSGSLPSGLSLSTSGVLSGTPGQPGSFPITVKVTDANGCFGVSSTYTLVIACQTITVTNPSTTTGTAGVAFSQTFTQSGVGTHTPATFTTASTLPTGFSLSTSGVLSGTTTQHGSFGIVVTVTDVNGCTGTGSTYNLVIACNAISVTNPVNTSGTVASPFSETFTSSGTLGTPAYTTASALPTGLTLHSATGILDGTPTQAGSFPIVVTVTDSNGCTGTGSTYTLVIACNVISVTNPGVTTGTAGTPFSQQFNESGGNGTIVWSETGALPSGITINSSTGFLFGTTSQTGSFPITVTATDANGCTGTGSTYTLTINCQTVTVTNPGQTSVQAGVALDVAFTANGILGTATWSETGTLPSGISLNSSTGHLSGTTNAVGSFPITVTATDTNGCFGTSSYTLTVTCPTITVTRTGGGSFPAATFNVGYPAGNTFTATGQSGTIHWAFPAGDQPPGINLTIVAGSLSGIPSATGTFNMTPVATDQSTGCTGTATFPFSILPNVSADSYSNLVNNTQAYVTGGSTSAPATPAVQLSGTIVSNDTPASGVTVDASSIGTFPTTQGGSVTIAADGTFKYTPPLTSISSDTFTYTGTSNTGTVPSIPQYAASTGPATKSGTVTLNLTNRVWYVKNNAAGGGNGQSQSPFNTLAAAQTASAASDIIFVYNGDGTTANQTAGITLKANQQLIGEGVALVVNSNTLVAAGTKPQISNTTAASDAVTLNDGNTVKGLTITGATRDGISSVVTHAGFTADTLTVQNNTNVGVDLISMTGTVTITNSTISTVGNQALTINNGTAAVTVDNTNTINGGTGTAVAVLNRPAAAGAIAVGATLNNGQIQLTTNASGTISFTGSQTLSNGTVNGVTMTTNTGATVNFSGTLNVTTTTGVPFQASGGGTLNVTGTANVTAGAAATGVNLTGITAGASGVTFTTVNTTGATTGVSLTSLGNGNVTINSGTISGGTTGLSLSTLGTSTVTLGANGQTLTLTGSTTAISGSTFGTLAVASGSTVNVSGGSALNLATGVVSGTFANVSSTGGTNGVNLNAVTGTWATTAGALTGAAGSTFNVTGTSGTVTWGGTINQANGANVVTIASSNTNTITFSGNVTTSGTSTGINISGSSGTYNFTGGTSTLAGSGAAVTISNESGAISFGSGYAISATSPAFKIGGSATNTTANITYSGTMAPLGAGGTLLDINSVSGTYSTGTITFNGTTLGGSVGNPTGIVSVIKSMTGTLVANNLNLTANNNGFSGTLLTIGGTNTGGNFTFNHLVLSANGTGHTGAGLTMSGGGTLTITATGGASSIDASSTALNLNGVALGASTLATVNSSGGTNGILLTSVTGGTMTISGGTLSGNSGAAFQVTNGSPTVSDAGTISSASAGGPVNMSGVTSGTMSFSGAVSSTSGGVSITTNGATVAFTGGISLSTGANNAFTATGGGTVTATQNNGTIVNTLTTTTGTALNVATTNIGAAGLTFRSITAGTAASGPANAVILNNTGATAGLTVVGNAGAGTGGTIQKTSSQSILLTSTKNVNLSFMNIQNSAAGAISGTSVNGFSLTSCSITGNVGGINDGQTAAVILTDTTNAVAFVSDTVTGTTGVNAFNAELHASAASTAAITTLTVTGGSYSNSAQNGGFLIDAKNTSKVGAAFFSGVTFNNNFSKGLQMAQNDASLLGDSVTAPLAGWGGPPNGSITVTGCTFVGNNVAAELDGGTGAAGATGSTYYRFVNNGTALNPIVGIPTTTPGTGSSHALVFANGSDSGGGSYKAFISGNFIGSATQIGSAKGNGMRIFMQGQQTSTVTVVNNSVMNCPIGRGIEVSELGRPGANFGQTQLNVKLTGNTVNPMDSTGFPLYAIYVGADAQGTGTSGSSVAAEIHGNTVPATSACDTQCGPTISMIAYETVSGATGTHNGTLFQTGPGGSVSADISATNTGTAGKTSAYINGGTLTLTGVAPPTVN